MHRNLNLAPRSAAAPHPANTNASATETAACEHEGHHHNCRLSGSPLSPSCGHLRHLAHAIATTVDLLITETFREAFWQREAIVFVDARGLATCVRKATTR